MPQTIQRSFTSGEIAPALQSRADLTKYATGLNLCQNFIVRAQGGVYSRPGLKFIAELDDSTKQGRLIPFSFNTEQTYILQFEDLKMRVIKDGGQVLAGGGPSVYELTTPYTEADLPDLVFTQNADVMTITHRSYEPRNLTRTADDAWTLTTINYAPTVSAPLFSATSTVKNVTNITLANPCVVTHSGNSGDFPTGSIVSFAGIVGTTEMNGNSYRVSDRPTGSTIELELDSSAFTAYVSGGTVTKLDGINTVGSGFGSYGKTYEYVITAVDENGIESLASPKNSISTVSLSVTGGVRLSWDAVTGADYYRIYKSPSVNTDIFGWIGDSRTTSFDDFNLAPITSDAPPQDRQPFTGAGNYPGVVTYYQQRQVFANTTNEPQTVFTTQTADYNSLRTSSPARDDDAVTFTIAARQVNEIRHLVPMDTLVILTSGGEWVLSEGQDRVLTPSTVGVRIQSYNGASKVTPVVVNNTVLYVQEKGTRLRDLGYEFNSDAYTGSDLSLMAEHLFEGKQITEMAYAAEPYSVVWCVRDDGVLLGLTYQREHQVWGWHQHITDGEVESVATVTEGDVDAVYVIVKRTINGATKRYVERMAQREQTDPVDAFCVDSGLTYDGAAATVISGLDHLEGETVSILADGNVVPDQTVSSGQITLTTAASKVHVGLAYTPAIETLDLDSSSTVETMKSLSLSVSKVTIEVEATRGGYVGPRKDFDGIGELTEIKPRRDDDGYGTIPLRDYKAEVFIQPQWSKTGGLRIEQRAPLPMAILSVIPQVDIGGN